MVPARGAQAFGAAQSYALKQFMRSLFQIPTGDREDADFGAPERLPGQCRHGFARRGERPNRQASDLEGGSTKQVPIKPDAEVLTDRPASSED